MALVRDLRDLAAGSADGRPRVDEINRTGRNPAITNPDRGRPRFGKSLKRSVPLFEQMLGFGFCLLGDEEAGEVSFGLIDQSWKVSGGRRALVGNAIDFAQFTEPGFVKIGVNLSALPAGDGAFLSTQTRVFATDGRTRRIFGVYWLLIRPFSGMIRRSWLQAAVRRVVTG